MLKYFFWVLWLRGCSSFLFLVLFIFFPEFWAVNFYCFGNQKKTYVFKERLQRSVDEPQHVAFSAWGATGATACDLTTLSLPCPMYVSATNLVTGLLLSLKCCRVCGGGDLAVKDPCLIPICCFPFRTWRAWWLITPSALSSTRGSTT